MASEDDQPKDEKISSGVTRYSLRKRGRPATCAQSEKKKKKARASEGSAVDRLSDLPDSVLGKILSLIGERPAVQTSVLAKRYKNLWTFSLQDLCLNGMDYYWNNPKPQNLGYFDNFVSKFLSGRDNFTDVRSLEYIRLRRVKKRDLERVVSYAVSHNVQRLKVMACSRTGKGLPPNLFTSRSLKFLKLWRWGSGLSKLLVPTFMSLPNLTKLYLSEVSFQTTSSACSLSLSGCINLKHAYLHHCHFTDLERFHILCPRLLEQLRIDTSFLPFRCKIVVTAPQLTSFQYLGTLELPPFSFCGCPDPPSLVDVFFLGYMRGGDTREQEIRLAENTLTMLREFRDPRSVTISGPVIKALSMHPGLDDLLPPFTNLKSLKLQLCQFVTLSEVRGVVRYLLRRSPAASVFYYPENFDLWLLLPGACYF